MQDLSMGLHERIVSSHEAGESSHSVLATRSSASKAAVGKLVRQQREQGTLEPQVHLRSRKLANGVDLLPWQRKAGQGAPSALQQVPEPATGFGALLAILIGSFGSRHLRSV